MSAAPCKREEKEVADNRAGNRYQPEPDCIFRRLRCEKYDQYIDSAGNRQPGAVEDGSDEQTKEGPSLQEF